MLGWKKEDRKRGYSRWLFCLLPTSNTMTDSLLYSNQTERKHMDQSLEFRGGIKWERVPSIKQCFSSLRFYLVFRSRIKQVSRKASQIKSFGGGVESRPSKDKQQVCSGGEPSEAQVCLSLTAGICVVYKGDIRKVSINYFSEQHVFHSLKQKILHDVSKKFSCPPPNPESIIEQNRFTPQSCFRCSC